MKVYVATKFENGDEARALMHDLVQAGHTVTHDWTHDKDTSDEGMHDAALGCLDGVWDAHVLVIIHRPGMQGAWTEFGLALARLIPVVIVGGDMENVFEYLYHVHHVESVDEVIEFLDAFGMDFPVRRVLTP